MTPYISPLYNGLTPYPYAITQDLLQVPTKMVDITLMRIQRDETGSYEYWLPESGEVLLLLECKDGLLVLLWDKKE